MKKSVFIAILALSATQVFAQSWRSNSDATLANTTGRNGFFFSPIVEYSNLNKDWNTSVGGGFGFIAGDFFIGAYGLGMADDNLLDSDFETLKMGHGGFWVGYVTPQKSALHLFTSVKAGWGAVNINVDDDFSSDDAFFAFTPEAGLEVNVFRWFRIAGTVGYRFMNGLDNSPLYNRDELEGMTGTITFRIGGFGRERNRDRWD